MYKWLLFTNQCSRVGPDGEPLQSRPQAHTWTHFIFARGSRPQAHTWTHLIFARGFRPQAHTWTNFIFARGIPGDNLWTLWNKKKKSTNFYWKLTKKQNKIDKDISEFFLLLEKSCSLFSWWHFTFRMVKSVIGNHEYHA